MIEKRFRVLDRHTRHDILGGAVERNNSHLIGIVSAKTLDDLEVGAELDGTVQTESHEPIEVTVVREQ